MNKPASRLEVKGIRKSFGGTPVLRDVDLSLNSGEVLALLGQNGAGKSTLIKILCGEYTRDAGLIRLDGQEVEFSSPNEALAQGIRMLPQELSVIPEMTVAENIMLGQLPLRSTLGLSQLDRRKMNEDAAELLAQLGREIDPTTPVRSLAIPEQRIVEIARALAGKARILVMDEPSASLTDEEVGHLFEVIRRLKKSGVSVIYISHYLNEIFEIADSIVVLRDGGKTGEFVAGQASYQEVVIAMVGNTVEDMYPESNRTRGEELLSVSGLRTTRVHGVDFNVHKGEILGLFGLIGSGIGVVGKALFGALERPASGTITLRGKQVRPRTTEQAKQSGVGYIAAERKAEGVIPDMTVRENMSIAFLERYTHFGNVSRKEENTFVNKWMKGLSIKAKDSDQKIRFLSGGNQQKVCIARWLVDGIDLLIMDEPTRGVDVGARKEIYAEIEALASQGMAVLLISSDPEEIAGMSDRVLVFNRGVVLGEYERGVTTKELMDVATQAAVA